MKFNTVLEIADATVAVERAYSNYTAKISQIAQRLRKTILIPWLEENGYNFVSGNGDYLIYDPSEPKTRYYMNDEYMMFNLPEHINAILHMEVKDVNSELGLWMLDYKSGG